MYISLFNIKNDTSKDIKFQVQCKSCQKKKTYLLFRGGQVKVRCDEPKGFKPSQVTLHGLNRNVLEHHWHFSDPSRI